MSLVKKPVVTEKKLEANRRNLGLSHGPKTPEGRARIGAAHLRHGLYAKAQAAALHDLGEDPAGFEDLLEGLCQEFTPAGTLQEELVIRLARALWLMDRSDRSQEGAALRRARNVDSGRQNRLHARMMRLKMTSESLRSLARSVTCWHYVTTTEDLEVMKKVHQDGLTTEMGEIALALFYQLQEPGTDPNGMSEDERNRAMANSMRSIFGLGPIEEPVGMLGPDGNQMVIYPEGYKERMGVADSEEGEDPEKDDRYPKITAEDWRARERARRLLKNILSRQAEACETQRQALLRESIAGPSTWERAAEITPDGTDALVMRRLQDANFREVRRVTNLLLKIKSENRKKEALEANEEDLAYHDVQENKGLALLGENTQSNYLSENKQVEAFEANGERLAYHDVPENKST